MTAISELQLIVHQLEKERSRQRGKAQRGKESKKRKETE